MRKPSNNKNLSCELSTRSHKFTAEFCQTFKRSDRQSFLNYSKRKREVAHPTSF